MPLQIVRNDITRMRVDAIVNAANPMLLGGGGVDGAIHRAAGPELLRACAKLGGCEVGGAKLTPGFRLPCKYVIHTVGPIWRDGQHGEPQQLASCYRASLALAKEHGCETIAFPLISTGAYGYPMEQAFRVARDTIADFLAANDMTVFIIVFDRRAYSIGEALYSDILSFIDDHYVDEHLDRYVESMRRQRTQDRSDAALMDAAEPVSHPARAFEAMPAHHAAPLRDVLEQQLDESFSQMLLRKIDEKGLTDAQCYKKANIDRKLFSKIRGDIHYKPSKPTAIAFAIALELPLSETKELLMKAGFALSRSSKFDIIIEYFIRARNYSIFEINEALFAFDQNLLGA